MTDAAELVAIEVFSAAPHKCGQNVATRWAERWFKAVSRPVKWALNCGFTLSDRQR